jgi:hypothetical protein
MRWIFSPHQHFLELKGIMTWFPKKNHDRSFADLASIRDAYQACRGFKPEFASPIRLPIAERCEHHA